MPSFTFVSTANAFALKLTPVFVDIDPDTLCMDLQGLQRAINNKTKAVVIVHYSGICPDMTCLLEICNQHDICLIEDAAHAFSSTYKDQKLGTFGDLACFSFHDTKNLICGEGGALVINNPTFIERAQVIRDKGTNRSLFSQGKVDKYTWVGLGSSYVLSELNASFLYAQLENSSAILSERRDAWWNYFHLFANRVATNIFHLCKFLNIATLVAYFCYYFKTLQEYRVFISELLKGVFGLHFITFPYIVQVKASVYVIKTII